MIHGRVKRFHAHLQCIAQQAVAGQPATYTYAIDHFGIAFQHAQYSAYAQRIRTVGKTYAAIAAAHGIYPAHLCQRAHDFDQMIVRHFELHCHFGNRHRWAACFARQIHQHAQSDI